MAKPQTIIRDGSGTRTATYQLPPGLFQYIESILVELDNGAAVDVRPTLKVETVNGQVMAAKRQGEAVPAGDTGTATWALRLTDETPGVTAAARPVGFYNAEPPGGPSVPAGTHSVWMQLTFAGAGAGVDLLDVQNGTPFSSWVPKVAGVYCYMARIGMDPDPPVTWPAGNYMTLDLTPLGADPPPANFWATQATTTFPLVNSLNAAISTIYVVRWMAPTDVNVGAEYGLHVSWNYAGAVTNVSGFVEAIRIG